MTPRLLVCTLCLLTLVLLPGCAEEPSAAGTTPDATADSAFVLLQSMQREAMQQAFGAADEGGYLRLTRTEQIDDGVVLAFSERLVRLRPDAPPQTLRVDTTGTFEFGFFGRFVDEAAPAAPANPAAHVLPDDPAFLTARNREAFIYRLAPDTSWFGQQVRVVDVRARPGTGENQALRHVRLYIDPASDELVGLSLARREETWLYDEASRFELRLRPSGGTWHPHVTDVVMATRLPFSPPRTFRTTSSYFLDTDAP